MVALQQYAVEKILYNMVETRLPTSTIKVIMTTNHWHQKAEN